MNSQGAGHEGWGHPNARANSATSWHDASGPETGNPGRKAPREPHPTVRTRTASAFAARSHSNARPGQLAPSSQWTSSRARSDRGSEGPEFFPKRVLSG